MEIFFQTFSTARCPSQKQTKKKELFITVVMRMVLNIACILAQWHEASLLCKGKKKYSWNCSLQWCVALPSVCHSFHCSPCWKWDCFWHVAGVVQGMLDWHRLCGYSWNTINKARKGRNVPSGAPKELPSDVGIRLETYSSIILLKPDELLPAWFFEGCAV